MGQVIPGEPMYRKTTLTNGIRVVTLSMPHVRSIAMGIMVDAGPRNEDREQGGLAHLVEHILFQGTSDRNATQIAQLIDVAGGQMGAFTARDYTCFTAMVLDEHQTYALDLLGDMLLNSILPAESIETEKEAILREIDGVRDNPEERAHALLKAAAWRNHPLGNPVAGRRDTLKALTREDAIYFVHKHYLPDAMIVAAAGNLLHEDFVAQVLDAFWRMLGQNQPAICEPPAFHGGVTIEYLPVSQTYFSLGMRALPYAHPDRYALHILNNLLGGGVSSRLFSSLRKEKGLVYEIRSEYHAYRDAGILVIEGSTVPENLVEVLGTVLAELKSLVSGGEAPGEEELLKAKMQVRGQHLISAENTSTQMTRLASQEFYFGRHIPTEEILAEINAVDSPTLKRVADEVLAEEFRRLRVAVVGPEAPQHYSPSLIQELLATLELPLPS